MKRGHNLRGASIASGGWRDNWWFYVDFGDQKRRRPSCICGTPSWRPALADRTPRGQLKSADTVNYAYDGDGNRVEKSNGTIYWYGPGGQVLDETDLSGNLQEEYVYFDGRRIAMRDSSGSIEYYAEDFLGSSRVMTTSSGVLCYDADFLPYGQEVDYTDTCGSNYKFEGKERDTETNNDDFGARYYRSVLYRWISPDWSATVEPVPYANLTNPQTLNLYAMVTDNPESMPDPDGHRGILAFEGDAALGSCMDATCVIEHLDAYVIGKAYSDSAPPQPVPQKPHAPPTSPSTAQQQNMSLSSKGLAFIEQHEGYSSTVYKDSAGNPTICYGHLIKKGEDFSKGITKDQANALLAQDVKGAVGAVNADLKVAVSQTKFDALVDFTYNLGGKNFANSTLLSNINTGKAVIESNFTSYNHAGGKVVPGLTTRRTDEFNIFSRGDYGGP